MGEIKNKSLKEEWYEKIRIVAAQTDLGKMYYLVDDNYDFIPLIKEYLNMIQARAERELSPNTVKTYCYLLWYFVVFLKIKDLNILDLDGHPNILVQFKLWLKNPYRFYENIEILNYDTEFSYVEDLLNVTTINAIINRVSSLYLWLKASNRIKENPVVYRNVMVAQTMRDKDIFTHIRHNRTIQVNTLKSKIPKILPKTVEQKDFKRFLDSVNLLRDKIILLCLKEGGFRSNELLGVHLEDIDFAEQGLWIRFRPDNSNGSRAKSGYGRDRFVHLPMDLMTLIDRYISSEWLESDANNDFLFVVVNSNTPSNNGNAMTKSTLDSMFKYYSKKIGLHLHPHILRHTHVTELAREYLKKGKSINWEFISKRIGHTSITTTIQIYAHLNHEDYKSEYYRLRDYKTNKIYVH